MDLIILAAGKGSRIFNSINKNKCLIEIGKQTLIKTIVKNAKSTNLFNSIHIVVGYKKKNIFQEMKNEKVSFIYNKDYANKEMLHSIKLGLKNCKNDVIISYSDIIYSKNVFFDIHRSNKKNFILPILNNWKSIWNKRKKNFKDDCETLDFDKNFFLKNIGEKINFQIEPSGQFMGIWFIPKKKIRKVISNINENRNNKIHTTEFLNFLIKKKEKIKCIVKRYKWYEFDDIEDLRNFNA